MPPLSVDERLEPSKGEWVEQSGAVSAARVAALVAAARIGIGVVFLVAPRQLIAAGRAGSPPSPEAVALARMAAGRDVALGVGSLLAAKQGPGAVRAWVQAGAVADGTDVVVLARMPGLLPAVRAAGVVTAAAATLLAVVGSRFLGR